MSFFAVERVADEMPDAVRLHSRSFAGCETSRTHQSRRNLLVLMKSFPVQSQAGIGS